jgi:hypothetical protein
MAETDVRAWIMRATLALRGESDCVQGSAEALIAEAPSVLASMAGLMEVQHISPECRAGRTVDGAWDEAVRRLREIYDAQVQHDPTLTIAVAISRAASRPADADRESGS